MKCTHRIAVLLARTVKSITVVRSRSLRDYSAAFAERKAASVPAPILIGLWLMMAAGPLRAELVIDVPDSAKVQHILVNPPPNAALDPTVPCTLVEAAHVATRLPAQLVPAVRDDGTVDASAYRLLASIPPSADRAATRTFLVEQGPRRTPQEEGPQESGNATPAAHGFHFIQTPNGLKLVEAGTDSDPTHQIWQYNSHTQTDDSLPTDNPLRSRSCYVHPVWGLHGEILTDDFPRDHPHHHGVFWTWPYVKIGQQTYDLWLSTDIQQQFVKWLATEAGPVAGVLGVENGWFVGQRQVATERVWLRTYRSQPECRVIDVSLFIEGGEEPVTLHGREEKSYGGLTVRFDVWPRTEATVRVPGHTLGHGSTNPSADPDLVNTRLPWADLTSQFPGPSIRSGAAVFIHPQHPDYPPTWLTRTYGALCVGWPGVQTVTIAPGESIQLDYRIWIHARELESDQIDLQYRAYCTSLEARYR